MKSFVLCRAVPALLACALAAGQGLAQDRSLESELERIADWIEKQVEVKADKLQCKKEVSIRIITKTTHCNVNARIHRTLVQILNQRKVAVSSSSRLQIEVHYTAVKLTDTKQVGYGLDILMIDVKTTKLLIEYPRAGLVTKTEEVIPALGITGKLPSTGTKEDMQRAVWQLIEQKPEAGPGGAFADKDQLYGMEILVRKGDAYEPRDPAVKDGLAFVSLAQKEIYAIRLVNNADHEVAVTLTIDGLNLFTFAMDKDYPVVLVPAKKSVTLFGWPLNLKKSAEFRITHYCESAVREVGGDPKNTGVIVATFAAAWKKGDPVPKGEDARSVPAIATGRGNEVETPAEYVPRFVGRDRAVVSMRYAR